METNRQKKIAGIIQKDIAEILQNTARNVEKGLLISVTKVYVTSDLHDAKVYVSIFPSNKSEAWIKSIKEHSNMVKSALAKRTRNQLRRVPELAFFLDDSLDYIEIIDKSLQGKTENPIKNPDILPKRKKL
ncbi:MAG: ribosome-binding factor A [Flavobacteriales bacterium]|nr:MAG: ribosome-binding factor A [Flavobacteriales bacterium]PIE48691.1 MAG: ribosome-binding factor A [Flavobacteriales bacterium]